MGTLDRLRARMTPLTLPFGVVGLVGGLLVAVAMGRHAFDGWGALLLGTTTALVAARLGTQLSRTCDEALIQSWPVRVVVRALLAGGLNGALVLALCLGYVVLFDRPSRPSELVFAVMPGMLAAWLFGVVLATAFLPSLLLVTAVGRRALAARSGSMARRVLLRRTWLVTLALAAGHLVMALYRHSSPAWRELAVEDETVWTLAMSLLIVLVPLAATVASDAARARRALRDAAALPVMGTPEVGVTVLRSTRYRDLGVGDDERVAVADASNAYRETPRAEVLFTGDVAATRGLLRGAAAWMAIALPVALSVGWAWVSAFL